ncbi:hypothetical protein BD410DRAFT_893190 [Rickenella mellea]|uniref:Uncharacterized protein n=1 Tax=Rickenella mellea TaxID=50990 RepID=A0A4R5XH88_9AGAM|nr:hypothetical protein BD410DRAFT_893190 [Rickenella mellea]
MSAQRLPSPLAKNEGAYAALHMIGGHVGLPLFVGTIMLSKRLHAHYSMLNFCLTWIIFSIVFCLTIYDRHDNYSPSGGRLCFAQAAMVQGVVPMVVTGSVFLVFQVWEGLRGTSSRWTAQHPTAWKIITISSPYVAFSAFSLAAVIVMAKNSYYFAGDRYGAYFCSTVHNPINLIVPGYTAFLILIMLILEGWIVVTLVRHGRALRDSRRLSRSTIHLMTRIGLFSIYSCISLGVCAAFLAQSTSAWPYLVEASLPTAAFVIFGTRPDVWRVWLFWPKPQGRSSAPETSIPHFIVTPKNLSAQQALSTATLVELKKMPGYL